MLIYMHYSYINLRQNLQQVTISSIFQCNPIWQIYLFKQSNFLALQILTMTTSIMFNSPLKED